MKVRYPVRINKIGYLSCHYEYLKFVYCLLLKVLYIPCTHLDKFSNAVVTNKSPSLSSLFLIHIWSRRPFWAAVLRVFFQHPRLLWSHGISNSTHASVVSEEEWAPAQKCFLLEVAHITSPLSIFP